MYCFDDNFFMVAAILFSLMIERYGIVRWCLATAAMGGLVCSRSGKGKALSIAANLLYDHATYGEKIHEEQGYGNIFLH